MRVYLIVHPHESRNLPLFMQGVNQSYAKYFNSKYNSSGKVWGQRYRSALIHNDKDLFDAVKLVEFIPVEKRRCYSPAEYPWSSCSLRILGSGGIVDTMPPEHPMNSIVP
jgi:putative transposase